MEALTEPPPESADSPTASPERTFLGIDYGTVRIGLALGFLDSGLVIQLPILPNPGDEKKAIESLTAVVRERAPLRVVLGNPVMPLSGDPSAMSKIVARVAAALESATGIEVVLQDERRSSVDAEEELTKAGLRWWQYGKGQIDTMAAMAIVRGHLVQENPSLAMQTEEPPDLPDPKRDSRRDRRRRARKGRKR
jgi:putative Holliday junction resolvase